MITNRNIDGGNAFDWGRVSPDYAKFRDIYPDLFYQKIVDMGLCVQGQRVLDLGTGTGVLPRHLYRYGASFVGADISENQIEQARRLSKNAGMAIEYIVASAEDINFPERSFDVVTACQCFEYFDKTVVLPKLHSILREGGHFCILYMAWLPEESAIARHSEALVLKYNPRWTGAGYKRHAPIMPERAGEWFVAETLEGYGAPLPFTRESWHGRMKACRGTGASVLQPEAIGAFDREHKAYLQSVPETFCIPHFVTIVNLRKKEL